MTLAQLCDLYLTEGLATRKATSIASARGNIENHTKPLLGAKRASLQSQQRLLGALGPSQDLTAGGFPGWGGS
jgi:hypothetical protein